MTSDASPDGSLIETGLDGDRVRLQIDAVQRGARYPLGFILLDRAGVDALIAALVEHRAELQQAAERKEKKG